MKTKHNFSTYTLLVSLVAVSLIAVACSSPTPAPTPIVAKPTQAPTQLLPTISPTMTPMATPTAAPVTTPTANILSIGQAQTMNQVSILPSKYQLLPESGSDKPKTGDQYLVVTFSIENTSKTANFNFDPANMVILDPTGTVMSMVSLKSLTNELKTQTLKPGAKLNGVIAYELPQTESKWTLELKSTNNQNLLWSNAG